MVLARDPNDDWKNWGASDPYFAVLTDTKFLNSNLNDEVLREFFDSGERHVDHVYSTVRSGMRRDFEPNRVLDYGCGVGRLVVAFARRANEVVGIDVSPGMLEETRENCRRLGAPASVQLLHVNQLDSLTAGTFDLVHSHLVFQHIPVARGELVLRRLISLLAEGGIGVIQLTCIDSRSAPRRFVSELRKRIGLVHRLLNLVQGRPFSTPLMQMNSYSMNNIFKILIETRCSNLRVEFWEHQGIHGVVLYFEKSPQSLSQNRQA